jgi:hypothetical protein
LANQLLTIGMITRETLMVLVNMLTFTKHINREYDDQFGRTGAKIGSVVNVRKPVRFVDAAGQGLVLQDLTETSVPLALTTQYQRAFTVTSADLELNIDDFSKRFIRPAIASMANQIDFDGLNQYLNVFNEVGTPGTVPNSASTYLQAGQKLDDQATPRDGERYLVITTQQNAIIINALSGLFNPQRKIGEQYDRGLMSEDTLGFDWYMDQNARIQVVGPQGGVPVINGANQTGSAIITNGWTAAAAVRLNQGDVVTLPGVFAVNPQNHQSTGQLAQWVVTATTSSDGAGNLTIPIAGPDGNGIITSGPFQNASASPTNGLGVTVQGAANTSSQRGLAFHKDAFSFACADLLLPNGVDMRERISDKQLGLSIRIIRAYDINTDRLPLRCDLLGGWTTLYPQLACRIAS